MSSINNKIEGLELAQIGWVIPDIRASVKFLTSALGITGFPQPEHIRAQDLGMTYYGEVVPGEWLTTQTYNGGTFIELIQPVSSQSKFHDYLARCPTGGTQHLAFRLPVSDFTRVTSELSKQGYKIISKVDHPIARMAFFVPTKRWGLSPKLWA